MWTIIFVLIIFKIFECKYETSCHVSYEISTVLFVKNFEYNFMKIDDMLVKWVTDQSISAQNFENNLIWIVCSEISF